MKGFPTEDKDSKPDSPIQKIITGAAGIPLVLSAAPTTSGNELPVHGDMGFFGLFLYINLDGSTYRIPLTLV